MRILKISAVLWLCAGLAAAQDFRVPENAVAGEDATISTSGGGKATFYLVGPGSARKADVALGEEIRIGGAELRTAGAYRVVMCAESCQSASFYVSAAKPFSLAFLVHPSRVPVSQENAVSGVALPFDRFRNLVLAPQNVTFLLSAKNTAPLSHSGRTQDGVAWFRTASSKAAGPVQLFASVEEISAKRALQQVASDPCNLRINGQRTAGGVIVQTDPVHDCAGNIVPDGTVITFTATDARGKDSVDAPVKQGVAKAKLEAAGPTIVSAASGVVMGNELRIEAQR
ncbi:MAG TPA: hypothetical protein VND65_01930 [Candidatus Binatia bacterium]|nr:hypothetical protein [Candidatus Binatia bacterium]